MTTITAIKPTQNTQERKGGAARASDEMERVAAPDPLDRKLEQIEGFLQQLDGSEGAAARAVRALRRRLATGRLHVAVLGQFKRGKSSLLNALLGQELLPTAVVPLTAVPTFLRYGDALALRVSFRDGRRAEKREALSIDELRQALEGLVTEAGNPGNGLGVSQVEVFLPSALLAQGVVLIDTPGIGSTLRHNTEATLNFLPQCDAAFFVMSTDPPITEAEAQFLKAVRDKVRRIFFLLNKVDYLSAVELEQARVFLSGVLTDNAGLDPSTRILCTSARWGMEARRNLDQRLWKQSGLEEVEEHLVSFLAREKHDTLVEAVCARTRTVLGEVTLSLEMELRSWQLPLADLECKGEEFSARAEELDGEADRSEDHLDGDRQRLRQKLEEDAEALRVKARTFLSKLIEGEAHQTGDLTEEQLQRVLAEAIPTFFGREMTSAVQRFTEALEAGLEPHRRRAAELVATLQSTAAELFEVPANALAEGQLLEGMEEPTWVTHSWDTALHPVPPGLVDRLLPESRRKDRLLRRVSRQLEELVVRNVENLRWSVLQSLERSFLINKPLARERLSAIKAAVQEAVQRTLEKRRTIEQVSSRELARLEAALRELHRLGEGLESICRFAEKGQDGRACGQVDG
ncbi:MAG: dynamin family protein [Spirochaetales bacterium]|nr:dynamin family protein [Spirochaetales bacterium]